MKKMMVLLMVLCLFPMFGANAAGIPDSYANAYQLHNDITTAMLDTFNALTEVHNEGLEYEDPASLEMVLFLPFISIDMAFTAALDEIAPESTMMAVFGFFGIDDATFTRQAPHDYLITYTNQDELPVEMHCEFFPASGALRFSQFTDGALKQFQEFVPLDGSRYALQNRHQRALVTYADGQVDDYIYSGIRQSLYGDGDTAYDMERDGIFPGASGLGEAWVMERDDIQLVIKLDGSVLTVEGEDFLGNLKEVVISR